MKRKLAILVLLALVAMLAATPALAAGPGGYMGTGPGRQSFTVVGIIMGVNFDSDTITLEVYHGNRIGQEYIDGSVTVKVTDSTRYRQWAEDGCTPIDFAGVEAGQTASIQGTLSDSTFTAQRVTVGVPCCTP